MYITLLVHATAGRSGKGVQSAASYVLEVAGRALSHGASARAVGAGSSGEAAQVQVGER